MFCPNCGNNVPDGAKFCGSCGSKLQSESPVQTPVSQPVPQQNYYQQPSNQAPYTQQSAPYQQSYSAPANPYGGQVLTAKKPNTKLIAIVACVIVALIAGAWFLLKGEDPHKSPEAVLNAYIDAYNSKDAEAFLEISADYKRSNGDPEMRREYIEDFTEEAKTFGKASANIKSVEYEGDDRAYVICDVTIIESGETETHENSRFLCVKIDGKWYCED